MKVLHINTHDLGGAAVAAHRLHDALKLQGCQSDFLTLYNSHKYNDVRTFLPHTASFWYKKILPSSQSNQRMITQSLSENPTIEIFTSPDTLYNVLDSPLLNEADVIHLHWIANFIDFKSFFRRIRKPVVWTFHDENPFLGGFHYTQDLERADSFLKKMESDFLKMKMNSLRQFRGKMGVICPSQWMLKRAEESIYNELGLLTHIYNCVSAPELLLSKQAARSKLGLSFSDQILTFVANDTRIFRKGFDLLNECLASFDFPAFLKFLIVGETPISQKFEKRGSLVFMEKITDPNKLMTVYAASDALLIPSRQDNLPNVMIEALCMGCPVLGFEVGGIGDVVHKNNGLLSKEISPAGLAKTIRDFLLTIDLFDRLKIQEEALKNFSPKERANDVISFYTKVIDEAKQEY